MQTAAMGAQVTINPDHLLESCHHHLCYLDCAFTIHKTARCRFSGEHKLVFHERKLSSGSCGPSHGSFSILWPVCGFLSSGNHLPAQPSLILSTSFLSWTVFTSSLPDCLLMVAKLLQCSRLFCYLQVICFLSFISLPTSHCQTDYLPVSATLDLFASTWPNRSAIANVDLLLFITLKRLCPVTCSHAATKGVTHRASLCSLVYAFLHYPDRLYHSINLIVA